MNGSTGRCDPRYAVLDEPTAWQGKGPIQGMGRYSELGSFCEGKKLVWVTGKAILSILDPGVTGGVCMAPGSGGSEEALCSIQSVDDVYPEGVNGGRRKGCPDTFET